MTTRHIAQATEWALKPLDDTSCGVQYSLGVMYAYDTNVPRE